MFSGILFYIFIGSIISDTILCRGFTIQENGLIYNDEGHILKRKQPLDAGIELVTSVVTANVGLLEENELVSETTSKESFRAATLEPDVDAASKTKDAEIHLSFSHFSTSRRDHVEVEAILPPNAVVKIVLTDLLIVIDFLIVQVHSYAHYTILSYSESLTHDNHVNGTNIGLHYRNDVILSSKKVLYVRNPHEFNVSALIAAVPYTNESPIPGGCNLEAHVPIAPFLKLSVSNAMVSVEGAPASLSEFFNDCDMNPLAYIMFYKYLPERDFSEDTYFESIRSMLTYPRILNSSYVAPEPISGPVLRRVFSKYSGTGTVFSFIAFNKYGNVAVYTPAFTYACDSGFDPGPCELISSPALKIEFALIISISAFICFAGHRYFICELYFMGTIAGGLLSYILLLLQSSYSGDLLFMSTGIGLVSGALWLCVWWCINSPILSVALPFAVNGFLTSSTLFFYFLSGISLLQSDLNYWLLFLILTFMTFSISTTNPVRYNMVACSFVGAYGMLFPIDYYIGSNLKYIIVNVIRRATVDDFNLASTKPPFQIADMVLCTLWLLFFFIGYRSQKKLSVNRPPFPPVCLILREQMPEAMPILSNARFPTYT